VDDLRGRLDRLYMQYELVNRFRDHGFSIMKFAVILQHSQTHEYIMNNIASISYEGKSVLCIDVKFYIKLMLEKELPN
jgi:hypothetical protein